MCILEFWRFALHYLSIFFSRCTEIAALLVWIIFILLGLKLLNHVYNVLWFVFSLLWFQFKPLEQLMGVFPAASGKFLPPTWRELMSHPVSGKSSFLIDFYISVFYWSIDCLVDMFVDVYYLNSIFIDWLNDWFILWLITLCVSGFGNNWLLSFGLWDWPQWKEICLARYLEELKQHALTQRNTINCLNLSQVKAVLGSTTYTQAHQSNKINWFETHLPGGSQAVGYWLT